MFQDNLVLSIQNFCSSNTPVGQKLVLSVCSFLSLGATFSPKLSQLLTNLFESFQSPAELSSLEVSPFKYLLTYFLDCDNRVQVHHLIRILSLSSLPPDLLLMLVNSVVARKKTLKPIDDDARKSIINKLEKHLEDTASPSSLASIENFAQKLQKIRIEIEALLVNFGKPSKFETEEQKDEYQVKLSYLDCQAASVGQPSPHLERSTPKRQIRPCRPLGHRGPLPPRAHLRDRPAGHQITARQLRLRRNRRRVRVERRPSQFNCSKRRCIDPRELPGSQGRTRRADHRRGRGQLQGSRRARAGQRLVPRSLHLHRGHACPRRQARRHQASDEPGCRDRQDSCHARAPPPILPRPDQQLSCLKHPERPLQAGGRPQQRS